MKIYSAPQIRAWDQFTIANEPIASIELMERASERLTNQMLSDYPDCQKFVLVCGAGNNGGDGFAIARMLQEKGRVVRVYLFDNGRDLSIDAKINFEKLNNVVHNDFETLRNELFTENTVIVDALLGSGLERILDGVYRKVVDFLNSQSALRVSVDMPTGLPSDTTLHKGATAFHADMVYTFQCPKYSLLMPEHRMYAAEFFVVDISLHPGFDERSEVYYQGSEVMPLPSRGSKFNHKGSYGRAAIIGGSIGMAGAVVLATSAALRSGCGLCTAFIPERHEQILQSRVPEATLVLSSDNDIHLDKLDLSEYSAVVLGPGLGVHRSTRKFLIHVLETYKGRLVLDADALNIIALEQWQDKIPRNAVLTPHPKEFERLFGTSVSRMAAIEEQKHLSRTHGWYIVLKGAHTSVTSPKGEIWFNSSGNNGMAKGGSGDVLSGVLGGLLAWNEDIDKVVPQAVYWHGMAGDLAAIELGQINMLASDIVDRLFLV